MSAAELPVVRETEERLCLLLNCQLCRILKRGKVSAAELPVVQETEERLCLLLNCQLCRN